MIDDISILKILYSIISLIVGIGFWILLDAIKIQGKRLDYLQKLYDESKK